MGFFNLGQLHGYGRITEGQPKEGLFEFDEFFKDHTYCKNQNVG